MDKRDWWTTIQEVPERVRHNSATKQGQPLLHSQVVCKFLPNFSKGDEGCGIASLWLVTNLILKRLHDWPQFSRSVQSLSRVQLFAMQFMWEKIWTTFCDVLLIFCDDLFFSRTKVNNNDCWRECGEKGNLWIVGGNVKWCSHYGEQYGGSLKN